MYCTSFSLCVSYIFFSSLIFWWLFVCLALFLCFCWIVGLYLFRYLIFYILDLLFCFKTCRFIKTSSFGRLRTWVLNRNYAEKNKPVQVEHPPISALIIHRTTGTMHSFIRYNKQYHLFIHQCPPLFIHNNRYHSFIHSFIGYIKK